MHESVPNHDNPYPIFDLTRADFRLTQIVVHTKKAEDGDYMVLFLGTGRSSPNWFYRQWSCMVTYTLKLSFVYQQSKVLVNSENKNISNGFCSSPMGFIEFYDFKKPCELFCLKPSIFSESKTTTTKQNKNTKEFLGCPWKCYHRFMYIAPSSDNSYIARLSSQKSKLARG